MSLSKLLNVARVATAVVLIGLIFGKICYEYGRFSTPNGIGWWFALLVYAIILMVSVCIDLKFSGSYKFNIGLAIYISVPSVALFISTLTNTVLPGETAIVTAFFIIITISFLAEIITAIRKYKEN